MESRTPLLRSPEPPLPPKELDDAIEAVGADRAVVLPIALIVGLTWCADSIEISLLAFLYECVSWKCNCGSLWDFVLMGVVRRVTYAAQSAKFTDRVTQAFIDLVPALDTVLDLLLGRGCSSCPVSTAVLAKGSDVGCGEWLWPKGAGRAGDTCPPLPSSTASPKTGAAVGDKIILYIHGGAFVLCNHSTHRLITYELVRRTGEIADAVERFEMA